MSRFLYRDSSSGVSSDDTLSAADLSVGAIAGIAIAGAIVLFVGLAPLLVWLARRQDRQHGRDEDTIIEQLDMRLPPNNGRTRTSYLDTPHHKVEYDSRDEHGDDDDNNGGYDSGHGSKRSSLQQQQSNKRLRKKTTSSNASETTLYLESGIGRAEKGDHVDIAADAITPFLARPYGSSIQYEQRVPYEDEKHEPSQQRQQQQHQGDVITNMVRLSNKSHSHKRSWNGEDRRAGSSRNSNRSSNRSSTTTALINFAGNSDVSFTTSNRNSATASDRMSRPTTSTNRTRNSDSTSSNTASISTIRSWFPPSLGRSLVRKLSFGSRSVEEIIGNPRVLNKTGGDPNAQDAGRKEEISVHDTPRSTPVIVHNVTTGSSEYTHSKQAGGISSNAANASPVIPRAPASVIHNPRQRSTLTQTPGDAAFKQQQKLMMQQQQAKKQQQQMQMQLQMQQQQQQLLHMHQQQQQQMQMQLIHNNGHPLLAQLQSQSQSPPKRPPRFRQSATDSELTEILRMTAERLEDRNRSERRQQVVNSAADVAGSEGLRDSREDYSSTVRRGWSPAKVAIAASDKTSARESMLSSDTRGDNISLIVPAAQSSHTSLLTSGQVGQVEQQGVASGNIAQHRRRISHVSFASIVSEPDSLVPNDGNRPASQNRPSSSSHHTPLSSPSRYQAMTTGQQHQQQQTQVQASPADQTQRQRQHIHAVGGSHRPFSPASTESSALSTLYSEDEPGSIGGGVGTNGSPQGAVAIAVAGPCPERRQRSSRHGGVGIPQGLHRTDSQRKALTEVLRHSRDFEAKCSEPSMSPAPLRLRNSDVGAGGASTVDGGSIAGEYSPSMRDFQMIDTETDTIRSIVDGDLSCRNSIRHTFESSTIFTSYAVQTPRAAAGHDDDPFVSATPQHNARLSQLFSPLPKDGPRSTAMNAAGPAVQGRYASPSGMTTPSSTGNKASRGADRSSTMGGIDDNDYLAKTTSPSKRLTVHLTKATPEAETPTPMPALTPQRRKINMALRCLDGSPTLGSLDFGFETPQVYPETRLSSLYDSYHYSDRSDYKSDGTRTATYDNGDDDTTIIAQRSSTTLATSPTLAGASQEFPSSLRQVSARYRRDDLKDVDSDHTDGGGTDSDGTIERMVQDVLLPSRAENYYHDEPYKVIDAAAEAEQRSEDSIAATAAHTNSSTAYGGEDGERDTLGRLSTFEGDAKKMNSMRVTQAIAELRRMNSQVSTASGHTASISGSASNGGSDFDSPTLPQLRGGGFSPNKRRSSILGRRNYLAIGGGATSNRTSVATAADDSAVGAHGDEEDGAKEGIPRNASLWRRNNQGRSAAQRRAAWRRTMADPSSAGNKRAKSWMEEKPGDHDQWLSRKSLV